MPSAETRLAPIRRVWAPAPLRLEGVPRRVRAFVLATLGLATMLAVAMVVVGVTNRRTGLLLGTEDLPAWREVPRVTLVCIALGLAAGCAAICAAALEPGWRLRRLTLIYLGALGVTLAGPLRDALDVDAPGIGFERTVATGLSWIGVIAALALAVTPVRWLRRRPLAGPLLAALPALVVLVAFFLASSRLDVPYGVLLGGDDPNRPDVISTRAAVTWTLYTQAAGLITLLSALLLWQVIEAARATRDVAAGAAATLRRPAAVLAILLTAKVVWLALGYTGLLPGFAGGEWESWEASRSDGFLSWVMAIALVGVACWWLLRAGDDPVAPKGDLLGPLLVAVTIVAVDVMQTVYDAAIDAADRLPGIELPNSLTAPRVAAAWEQADAWCTALSPVAALLAGAVLFRRAGRRTTALFLVAYGAWALPRGIAIAGDLIRRPGLPGVGSVSDYIEGAEQSPAWIDVASADTVVTLVLCALAILWRTGHQRRVGPPVLLMVALGFTVMSYFAEAVPNGLRSGALFFAGVAFPVAYQYLADSEALNSEVRSRPARLLGSAGLAVLALTVCLFAVSEGYLVPETVTATDQGSVLFKPPFLALFLAVAISSAAATAGPRRPARKSLRSRLPARPGRARPRGSSGARSRRRPASRPEP